LIDPILIDLPVSIETDRLILRTPKAGDGAVFLSALTESLPELRHYLSFLPWVSAEPTLQSAELYCRDSYAKYVTRVHLSFFIFERESGRLVGGAGLYRISWATPKMEVGYWARTSESGNGYISEAVLALTEFAMSHLGAVRIELITDHDNLNSRKLAERCQFQLEGTMRNETRRSDGALGHTCMYARIASNPQ
jgi:RimJ/RimL family protein N-acetyltransferase